MGKSKRDPNIRAAFRKEIDLKTKTIPAKKHKPPKYKHKFED